MQPSKYPPALTNAARVAYWVTPIAFCLALYWLGLRIWFAQDDFAWLNLRNHVKDFHSFLWAMFAPMAQGTIRPFSERGFFMLFSYFFGLRALPYRGFIFLNQFLNIVLLMLVTRKLTKSELAGFLAPLFWLANAAIVEPMAWTAAYNEIQCATFLLSAFYWFLRYTETGSRKFYWAQWATFLLGFGALEINVVYPAIAAAYAFLFARRYFRSTLPLFAASILYALLHRLFSVQEKNFYYDMDFHVQPLLSTFAQYCNILFGSAAFTTLERWPAWPAQAAAILLAAAIVAFTAWQTAKRRYLPLFLVIWFLVVLAPLLPLHNHVTDYYLFLPAIGIAILAAYGVALARHRGLVSTALAATAALLYFVPAAIVSHNAMHVYFGRADLARFVVQSVAYAKRIHPGKTILLQNVDDTLFWAALYDSPFRIFGWNDIFVTPESRPQVHEDPNLGDVEPYFLPATAVAHALHENGAVVYAVDNRRLKNVTQLYTAYIDTQPKPELALSIEVGGPFYKDQLGEGWWDLDGGSRWSTKHAVVYLHGPESRGQKLELHGFSPSRQAGVNVIHFALTVDGRAEPVKTIDPANSEFRLSYDLPPDLVGHPKIEVAFTVDHTVRVPPDVRELGVAFGEFTIR